VQIKVGLSKLLTLRRVHCVFTASVVTYSILVCLTHHGTIPTIDRTRKPHKEKKTLLIKAYHVCIARLLRNPAQPSPYMELCEMKERTETTSEKAIVPRYIAILCPMTMGYHFRCVRLSYERSFLRR
jgi:hypothetical protein